MEGDAHYFEQCHGYLSKTDGSSFDPGDEKEREPRDGYLDDMVIATPTLADQLDRLDEVFDCMKRAGMKRKPSKYEIFRDSIKYLGRMVGRHGVRPDPDAVEAVLT